MATALYKVGLLGQSGTYVHNTRAISAYMEDLFLDGHGGEMMWVRDCNTGDITSHMVIDDRPMEYEAPVRHDSTDEYCECNRCLGDSWG